MPVRYPDLGPHPDTDWWPDYNPRTHGDLRHATGNTLCFIYHGGSRKGEYRSPKVLGDRRDYMIAWDFKERAQRAYAYDKIENSSVRVLRRLAHRNLVQGTSMEGPTRPKAGATRSWAEQTPATSAVLHCCVSAGRSRSAVPP